MQKVEKTPKITYRKIAEEYQKSVHKICKSCWIAYTKKKLKEEGKNIPIRKDCIPPDKQNVKPSDEQYSKLRKIISTLHKL
jgi:hypothetical protein